jgi:hypothetical protein
MLTLALLTALSQENELRMHVRAAVGNGVNADEIREVLLHTAVYAGVPAANSAFAVAQRVLAELGAEQATRRYSPASPHSPREHDSPDESAKDSACGPLAGPPDRIQGSPQGGP